MWGFLSGLAGAILGGVVAAVTAVSAAPAIIGGAVVGVALCITGVLGVCQNGGGAGGGTPDNTVVLTAQSVTQNGTLTPGRKLTFTGTVKNIGTAAYKSGSGATSRFCMDNADCASNKTGSFGSPTVPSLGISVLSSVSSTWTATAGDHTAYFCLVGGNCVNTSFTVAGGKNDCTITTADNQTVVVTNKSSRTFYDTGSVPYGQSCNGTDSSGNAYSQKRSCTTGSLSGSNSYNYANCASAPAPTQTEATLSIAPLLVRSGDSVSISWDGGNATACSIVGSNGFNSVQTSGANVSSGPITAKTTFTLSCTLGASTKTAGPVVVNLVPTENEI